MAAATLPTPVVTEKPQTAIVVPPSDLPLPAVRSTGGILDPILDVYRSVQARRDALGLSNPGTVDQISREVSRDVLLTNQTFSGLRAELNKSFSIFPLFQISHAFSTGSQQLSPYTFLALYGTNNILCQAQLDSDASFSARFNSRLTDRLVFKNSAQIQPASAAGPGGAQFSPEIDYHGDDFTASIKSMNPSLLEGGLTGMFIGSYMQSITKRLALGMEAVWQKPAGAPAAEAAVSYAGRYKGDDWIASAQLLTQGGLQASYWRRLTERVETGVDVSLQIAGFDPRTGGVQKEGAATFGAKYEFSRSVFRAQVDSAGKVGCLLDKIVAPAVRVTFAGEIDHAKSNAKLGLAVSIEASGEDLMEQQETVKAPVPPF